MSDRRHEIADEFERKHMVADCDRYPESHSELEMRECCFFDACGRLAALEAREAELESALRLILEEVDDPSRGSIHISKPARDAARKALAKARGEVSDA